MSFTTEQAANRRVLFNAWVKETQALKRPFVSLSRNLEEIVEQGLSKVASIKADGSEYHFLKARAKEAFVKKAKDKINASFKDAEELISNNVEKSVRRASRNMREVLEGLKVSLPTPEVVEILIKKELDDFKIETFPKGSGKNFKKRFEKAKSAAIDSFDRTAQQEVPVGKEKVFIKSIKKRLTVTTPGTSISGGSIPKSLQRFNLAEASRKASAIELALLKASNIVFVKWNLHPEHKWEGGKEICEVHAEYASNEVADFLVAKGLDPTKLDLEGVYLINDYPEYPHPFCKCFPMPYYPIGQALYSWRELMNR